MNTLISILQDKMLKLDGQRYRLFDEPARGGSSFVYKAFLEGDISKGYRMIKEFCPLDMKIERGNCGKLNFNESKDYVCLRKKRVARESAIVSNLRYDHVERNNNPWVLDYSSPIKTNNTLYTVIATENGEMLSEIIDNDIFKSSGFISACECIVSILNALEPIHKGGYLHLDISPDNIHFSDLGVARLIDFNSALSINEVHEEQLFSYKEGYSAPELSHLHESVGCATDLFSVTAIFFEIIKERLLNEDDWIMPKYWQLNNTTGYLSGASSLLVRKTNQFIQKGISHSPGIRFQSVDEMRAGINELIQMYNEYELVHRPRPINPNFVCRESEMQEINMLLSQNGYMFIEGIGGIGKTELATKYANIADYDIVQFLNYTGSLQKTIAMSLEFRNFDSLELIKYKTTFGDEAESYIFHEKMHRLNKHGEDGYKILIIVDNYESNDDNFDRFALSANYDVILTSREKHKSPFLDLDLKRMSERDAIQLFHEYHQQDIKKEDIPIIHEIIDLVLGHTMTVMLIATAMTLCRITPKEMLLQLQNGLGAGLRTPMQVKKDSKLHEEEIAKHIEILFDMSQLSSNQSYILANLSLLPATGIEAKLFYELALVERYKDDSYNDYNYVDINWLINHRWIQEHYINQISYISLHGVVAETAHRKLKESGIMCRDFVVGLIGSTDESFNKTYKEIAHSVEMLKMVSKRFLGDGDVMSGLFYRLGRLYMADADYKCALDAYKKAAAICEKESPYDQVAAKIYNNIGMIYNTMGDAGEAFEWYRKAMEIIEINPIDDVTATAYINIAALCNKIGNHNKALEYNQHALSIYQSLDENNHPAMRMALNNIAATYDKLGQRNFAIVTYNHALSLTRDESKLDTATICGNIAQLYCDNGDYLQAQDWNMKALKIRERMLGEEHPTTALSYSNIALMYHHLSDITRARKWYGKALRVFRKVYGDEHARTKEIQQRIFDMVTIG